MIDPNEKGVITRTQAVCRGSPKSFNISEQITSNLSDKTLRSLSKLDKYQIPSGLVERLKQKRPFDNMTDVQLKEILNEFKKYIAILVINNRKGAGVEMVSELVDEVWHTFILFTNEYRIFCNTVFGEYIHHEPNVSSKHGVDPLFPYKKKQSTEFFYKEYERCFGSLPQIWRFKSPDENVDYVRIERKNIAWSIIISVSVLISVGLVIQYYSSILYAQIETLLFGPVMIIVGYAFYKKTEDKVVKDVILKGTILLGFLLLGISIIFAVICGEGFFAKMLVLLYIGTVGSIAESSSKSGKKKYVGVVGGGCAGFGAGDGVGASGGCGGGGGCCG
ncbi:MAG TPA: hypothetical protein VLD84_09060 [Nitrososphaeraceae archaeon]|nr:hypothetical protein [Nitrososphaeraceae archaeon]